MNKKKKVVSNCKREERCKVEKFVEWQTRHRQYNCEREVSGDSISSPSTLNDFSGSFYYLSVSFLEEPTTRLKTPSSFPYIQFKLNSSLHLYLPFSFLFSFSSGYLHKSLHSTKREASGIRFGSSFDFLGYHTLLDILFCFSEFDSVFVLWVVLEIFYSGWFPSEKGKSFEQIRGKSTLE